MAARFAELTRPYFTAVEGPRTPLVAGVGLSCLVAAAVANPDTVGSGPVICPFRLATGLPCPGCGLTRSWVYLAHGRWGEAMSANPFGLVLMVAVAALVAAVLRSAVLRRPSPSMAAILASRPFLAVGAAWIVFGVVRLVTAV
jgi:hypothetical protein